MSIKWSKEKEMWLVCLRRDWGDGRDVIDGIADGIAHEEDEDGEEEVDDDLWGVWGHWDYGEAVHKEKPYLIMRFISSSYGSDRTGPRVCVKFSILDFWLGKYSFNLVDFDCFDCFCI